MLRIDMANEIEIKVPDIGGAEQVDVIEILVQVGDIINKETPLLTLESDKASMEIPSPLAGTVRKICLKVGDKVSEGDLMLLVLAEELVEPAEDILQTKGIAPLDKPIDDTITYEKPIQFQSIEIFIPDIGGATDVDVIDILVKIGSEVEKDQSLITLEGDKATMDIPSPFAGIVTEIIIKTGERVSQGSPILVLETKNASTLSTPLQSVQPEQLSSDKPFKSLEVPKSKPSPEEFVIYSSVLSAGPGVRRLARELGVNLTQVNGSGRKNHITKEDLHAYVKTKLSEKSSVGIMNTTSVPAIDFSKFGATETKLLSKIKKFTGINVHRSWITIPHVTQFDEADITDLEAFRKSESEASQKLGYKLTLLAFVCSVVSKALHAYPQFNASLDTTGEQLIYKKYYNIGIAVETTNGLVVPVIKEVNQLTVVDIAIEMARLSNKARDKGLTPSDMSGGCFTISSLGGIGGTAFTPIVNSPEVAILGISRAVIKPVYVHGEFKPCLMLPLSLSYDHRVIDGAEAARFTHFIGESLSDFRRTLL